jgi:DNA-directed RNA polymerase specialized sigma24 family protein
MRLVSAAEVAAAEQDDAVRQAAKPVDLRAGDAELFEELRKRGFAGPAYVRFRDELAKYGQAVTRAWIRSGVMFAECASRNQSVGLRPAGIEDHDIEYLADDTVTRALQKFRARALEGTGWRPDGRASLKTYFMTGCILSFVDSYRAWQRQQREQQEWSERIRDDDPSEDDFRADPAAEPEARLITKSELAQLLQPLKPRDRMMMILHLQGYKAGEIADIVAGLLGEDLQPHSVDQALSRARERIRRRLKGTDGPGAKR